MKRKLVSLYSGCGGLDLGLENAGFTTIFANDNADWCEETFKVNFPKTSFYHGGVADYLKNLKKIKKENPELLQDVYMVAGGPPCPPFSKSRFYRKEKPRALDDPSAEETISTFFKVVKLINPEVFILENVPGISYKAHVEAFNYLITNTENLGYKPSWAILNAADYGVPQIRQRFFLVGMKNKEFIFPERTHSEVTELNGVKAKYKPWVTAGEVLRDIDTKVNDDDTGHYAGGKHNDLLKLIPPGDNYLFFTEKRGYKKPIFEWRSRYWSFLLKLSPDLPSWTIQARRSNNMGPFHWKNRILRIGEVKRLQTFPDNWYLAGNVEQQWRQVGNAVPPKLAEIIGKAIIDQIETKAIKPKRKNALQFA